MADLEKDNDDNLKYYDFDDHTRHIMYLKDSEWNGMESKYTCLYHSVCRAKLKPI